MGRNRMWIWLIALLIATTTVLANDVGPLTKQGNDVTAAALPKTEPKAANRSLFNFDLLGYKENVLHKKISFLFSLFPRPYYNNGNYNPYGGYGQIPLQGVPIQPGLGYPVGVGNPLVPGAVGYPQYPARPPIYPGGIGVVPPGSYPLQVQQPFRPPVYPGQPPFTGIPGIPPFYQPVEAESNKPGSTTGTAPAGSPSTATAAPVVSAPPAVAPAEASPPAEEPAAEDSPTSIKKEPKIIKMMPKKLNIN